MKKLYETCSIHKLYESGLIDQLLSRKRVPFLRRSEYEQLLKKDQEVFKKGPFKVFDFLYFDKQTKILKDEESIFRQFLTELSHALKIFLDQSLKSERLLLDLKEDFSFLEKEKIFSLFEKEDEAYAFYFFSRKWPILEDEELKEILDLFRRKKINSSIYLVGLFFYLRPKLSIDQEKIKDFFDQKKPIKASIFFRKLKVRLDSESEFEFLLTDEALNTLTELLKNRLIVFETLQADHEILKRFFSRLSMKDLEFLMQSKEMINTSIVEFLFSFKNLRFLENFFRNKRRKDFYLSEDFFFSSLLKAISSPRTTDYENKLKKVFQFLLESKFFNDQIEQIRRDLKHAIEKNRKKFLSTLKKFISDLDEDSILRLLEFLDLKSVCSKNRALIEIFQKVKSAKNLNHNHLKSFSLSFLLSEFLLKDDSNSLDEKSIFVISEVLKSCDTRLTEEIFSYLKKKKDQLNFSIVLDTKTLIFLTKNADDEDFEFLKYLFSKKIFIYDDDYQEAISQIKDSFSKTVAKALALLDREDQKLLLLSLQEFERLKLSEYLRDLNALKEIDQRFFESEDELQAYQKKIFSQIKTKSDKKTVSRAF